MAPRLADKLPAQSGSPRAHALAGASPRHQMLPPSGGDACLPQVLPCCVWVTLYLLESVDRQEVGPVSCAQACLNSSQSAAGRVWPATAGSSTRACKAVASCGPHLSTACNRPHDHPALLDAWHKSLLNTCAITCFTAALGPLHAVATGTPHGAGHATP